MKAKSIFWGLFLICSAGLIIFNQMGYFQEIGLWSLLLTILLIPVIITSIPKRNFFGIVFPLGFLAIIYAEPLGIVGISPWSILIAALLLSIGLSVIFGFNKKNISHWHNHPHHPDGVIENYSENVINCTSSFAGNTKYINSENLQKLNINASFSGVKVFFEKTTLDPSGAEVHLDVSFSGVELYIPKHWKIKNEVECFLGGITSTDQPMDSDAPQLILTGNVSFGGVEIITI